MQEILFRAGGINARTQGGELMCALALPPQLTSFQGEQLDSMA